MATLLVGVGLRLVLPGDREWKEDEATSLAIGADFVAHPQLATHGLRSSVGLHNPPATVYVFALLRLLSRGDPLLASLCVVLFHSLGMLMAGAWLRKRTGSLDWFAVWWGLAYLCVDAWWVINSRKVWAQDLLLPFVVGAVWGLSDLWEHPQVRWRRVAPGMVCLVLASQIHMTGILWGVALVGATVLHPPPAVRQHWRALCAVAVGVTLPAYLPWIPEVWRHLQHDGALSHSAVADAGWIHLGSLFLGALAATGSSLNWFIDATEVPVLVQTFGGTPWRVAQSLALLPLGVTAVAAMVVWVRHVHHRDAPDALYWLASSVPLFILVLLCIRTPVLPHYSSILAFPMAAFWALGWSALQRRAGWRRWLVRAVAGALVVLMTWTSVGFLLFIHHNEGSRGDYGPVYRVKLQAAQEIVERGSGGQFPYEIYYLVQLLRGEPAQIPQERFMR
ncbi:MAG: hypothetical protein ABIJ09_12155 [Pseudomonadota bacterium]